jgi:hypothetical protein
MAVQNGLTRTMLALGRSLRLTPRSNPLTAARKLANTPTTKAPWDFDGEEPEGIKPPWVD